MHLSVKNGAKGKGAAHAQYIEREGKYAQREDKILSESGNMPVWAQQSPREFVTIAKEAGFQNLGLYGVHPHLLVPKMNTLLPPQLFNNISDSLCVFEDLPISLTWSSVFIAVFQKE